MSEVGDFDPFIRPRVGEIAAAREEAARRGGEDIGFGDFIDLINPLHHLPVIGPLYREITGDEIKPAAQILGGFLYGGPVGLVTSASQAIAEEATGKDVTACPRDTGPRDTGPRDTGPRDSSHGDGGPTCRRGA